MLKKFALAIFALVFVLAASGQQSQRKAPSLAQKVEDLLNTVAAEQQAVERLERRVYDLEQGENGRYQITAVTWNPPIPGNSGALAHLNVQFTAVFRVDTRTGDVCQVVSEEARTGELMSGTTLPHCIQK